MSYIKIQIESLVIYGVYCTRGLPDLGIFFRLIHKFEIKPKYKKAYNILTELANTKGLYKISIFLICKFKFDKEK